MRVKRVEAQDATGQTAKIALQEGKVAPPTKTDTVRTMKAKRVEASEGMGRTARIELQEGHSTAPQKPSSETVRTMKIKRTPDPETVRRQPVKPEQQTAITLTPEEEAAQGGVQTQRRTITIKRQEGMESERTMRLAQEEEEIRRERGDLTEGQPERVGWVCLVSAAALIVIGVMLWVFCTQLLPKSESFNWPGRILSFTDPFYQHGEPDWL